jgi:hypothetical protein
MLLDRYENIFHKVAGICFPNDRQCGKALLKAIVYDEQIHLFPPIIEDWFGGDTVGLGQVSYKKWGDKVNASSREQLRDDVELNLRAVATALLDARTGDVRTMIKHYNPRSGYGRVGRVFGYYTRFGGTKDVLNIRGSLCVPRTAREVEIAKQIFARIHNRQRKRKS